MQKSGRRHRKLLPEEVLMEQRCLHSAQPCPSLVLLKLLTHLLLPVEVLSWSTIQTCPSAILHKYALQLLLI